MSETVKFRGKPVTKNAVVYRVFLYEDASLKLQDGWDANSGVEIHSCRSSSMTFGVVIRGELHENSKTSPYFLTTFMNTPFLVTVGGRIMSIVPDADGIDGWHWTTEDAIAAREKAEIQHHAHRMDTLQKLGRPKGKKCLDS